MFKLLKIYWHPRHWPTWLGLACLWVITLLPLPLQIILAKGVARLAWWIVTERRLTILRNFELCFPEWGERERRKRALSCYAHAALGIFEGATAWWGNPQRILKRATLQHKEKFMSLSQQNKGLLVLGAHFTNIETSGTIIRKHLPIEGIYPIYMTQKNPLFNAIMVRGRERVYSHSLIERRDFRTMRNTLKKGNVIWYATDQDMGRKQTVFAPFFNIDASTLTTSNWFHKINGSPCIFFSSRRSEDMKNHIYDFIDMPEGFPYADPVQTATALNKVIETEIRKAPEQYLWVHRRFKTRPSGIASLYN